MVLVPGIDPMRLETHQGRPSILRARVVAEKEAGLAGSGVADSVGLDVDRRLPLPWDTPGLIVGVLGSCVLGPCRAYLREKMSSVSAWEDWLDDENVILKGPEAQVILYGLIMG